jgi:hypothetical protein
LGEIQAVSVKDEIGGKKKDPSKIRSFHELILACRLGFRIA